MSDAHVCYFDGRTYSHGAKICSNGKEQECRDGTWIDTGLLCGPSPSVHNFSRFTSADTIVRAEKFEGLDIEPAAGCGDFKLIHEGADYINLLNQCDDDKQIGISWSGSPDVLYYRMQRRWPNTPYIARQILIRGVRGRIVSAGPWNFRYGEDITRHARIYKRPVGDDFIVGITNPSSRHMVFRVDIYQDGRFLGYTSGVTEAGQDQDRIEAVYAGENKHFIVNSAYLDPE